MFDKKTKIKNSTEFGQWCDEPSSRRITLKETTSLRLVFQQTVLQPSDFILLENIANHVKPSRLIFCGRASLEILFYNFPHRLRIPKIYALN